MLKIGVLEDDLRVATFLKKRLMLDSYNVVNFSLINDLIDKLKEHDFHLLIMDRMIDQVDSLNYVRMIKSILPNVKIITISALSNSAEQIKQFIDCIDGLLEKPFIYNDLSLMIKKILNKGTSLSSSSNNDNNTFINLTENKKQSTQKKYHSSSVRT